MVAALALWLPLRGLPAPNGALGLSWPALAGAFAAAELCVVYLHLRRSAHSLTLGEIPRVLGLLLAPPADVVVGWVLGACMILTFGSRRHPGGCSSISRSSRRGLASRSTSSGRSPQLRSLPLRPAPGRRSASPRW